MNQDLLEHYSRLNDQALANLITDFYNTAITHDRMADEHYSKAAYYAGQAKVLQGILDKREKDSSDDKPVET